MLTYFKIFDQPIHIYIHIYIYIHIHTYIHVHLYTKPGLYSTSLIHTIYTYNISSSVSCHKVFILLFILFPNISNLTFSLIIFNNLIKNSFLSKDHCPLMYHFVIIIKKLIGSMWSFVAFGKPNSTSHSLKFNFTSNCWNIHISNLFHRFLLWLHWYKWCSMVSIASQ